MASNNQASNAPQRGRGGRKSRARKRGNASEQGEASHDTGNGALDPTASPFVPAEGAVAQMLPANGPIQTSNRKTSFDGFGSPRELNITVAQQAFISPAPFTAPQFTTAPLWEANTNISPSLTQPNTPKIPFETPAQPSSANTDPYTSYNRIPPAASKASKILSSSNLKLPEISTVLSTGSRREIHSLATAYHTALQTQSIARAEKLHVLGAEFDAASTSEQKHDEAKIVFFERAIERLAHAVHITDAGPKEELMKQAVKLMESSLGRQHEAARYKAVADETVKEMDELKKKEFDAAVDLFSRFVRDVKKTLERRGRTTEDETGESGDGEVGVEHGDAEGLEKK